MASSHHQKVARTVDFPADALGPVMADRVAQRTAEMLDRYLGRTRCDSTEGDAGRAGQRVEGRRRHAKSRAQPAADGEPPLEQLRRTVQMMWNTMEIWLIEKARMGEEEPEDDEGLQGCRGAHRGGECSAHETRTRRMGDALRVVSQKR